MMTKNTTEMFDLREWFTYYAYEILYGNMNHYWPLAAGFKSVRIPG